MPPIPPAAGPVAPAPIGRGRRIINAIGKGIKTTYDAAINHPRISIPTLGAALLAGTLYLGLKDNSAEYQSSLRNITTKEFNAGNKSLGFSLMKVDGNKYVNQTIPSDKAVYVFGEQVQNPLKFYSIPLEEAVQTVDERTKRIKVTGPITAWVPINREDNGKLSIDYQGNGTISRFLSPFTFEIPKNLEEITIPRFKTKTITDPNDPKTEYYIWDTNSLETTPKIQSPIGNYFPTTMLVRKSQGNQQLEKIEFDYSSRFVNFISTGYVNAPAQLRDKNYSLSPTVNPVSSMPLPETPTPTPNPTPTPTPRPAVID